MIRWIILKHVKCIKGVLLNERGKHSISYAWWKECDKTGCKIGCWRVIYILRFSQNSAQEGRGRPDKLLSTLTPHPHTTAIPPNWALGDEI
jgi:hypothetical protein